MRLVSRLVKNYYLHQNHQHNKEDEFPLRKKIHVVDRPVNQQEDVISL